MSDTEHTGGELTEPEPTVCSCGTPIVFSELPYRGIQKGGEADGWRFWCVLRNHRPGCGTTLAAEYRKRI